MKQLLDAVLTTCTRKQWTPHAASVTCTHIHAVISWTSQLSEQQVQAALKSGLGFCLSKSKGTTGNRWFSRGGVPTRVEDHAHLFRLLHEYLPLHASEEGGEFRNYEQQGNSEASE